MAKDLTQIWHSGDWLQVPAKTEPYNGLEITALPTYNDGILTSVKATVTDYTKTSKGSAITIAALTPKSGNVNIVDTTTDVDVNFTARGWLALESFGTSIALRLHISFGPEHASRNEVGYIMTF